jgi:hypothetical protein
MTLTVDHRTNNNMYNPNMCRFNSYKYFTANNVNIFIRLIGLRQRFTNLIFMILDVIHCPVFYLKHDVWILSPFSSETNITEATNGSKQLHTLNVHTVGTKA